MLRILPLLLLAAGSALAAMPKFAGTWKLDKAQSELSGRLKTNQADIDQFLKITLTETEFTVASETIGGPRVKVAATDTYSLDGKPHEFTPAARTGSISATGTRTATIAEGQREIVVQEDITRVMEGGTVTAHNTHTWTLSADGRTLTARTLIKGPQGEIPTTRRFVRVEPAASDQPTVGPIRR